MTTHKTLLAILTLGLILRLTLLLFFWDKPLPIVDETHYQAIAENIVKNHEFALRSGHTTSIRPPLYPGFLSAIYFLTGGIHFNAVRIVQIMLSLGIICMVYFLGQKTFDKKTGLLASFIFAIYPSFLFFTHFLLTEILFTFLLLLFVYFFLSFLGFSHPENQNPMPPTTFTTSHPPTLSPSSSSPRPLPSHALPSAGNPKISTSHPPIFSPSFSLSHSKHRALCIWFAGLFLGLGALTRSILYPFLFIAIVFLLFACRDILVNRLKWVILLVVGFAIVVSPWTARNFILYKDIVPIGTMGGLNLYMGNYEHTPLNRAWAAVDLTGDKAWYYGHEKTLSGMNLAQKQKWAIKKAEEFILNHKLLTLKRDLIKAANFWGLERAVIGGIINGHWPELNKKFYLIGTTTAVFLTYTMVVIASVFGILTHLRLTRHDVLFIVVLIAYFTGMHAIVFGHSRYHLPLIPLLLSFASWSLLHLKSIWEKRKTWIFRFSIFLSIIFIIIWVREIVFVEGTRYLRYIH